MCKKTCFYIFKDSLITPISQWCDIMPIMEIFAMFLFVKHLRINSRPKQIRSIQCDVVIKASDKLPESGQQ